MKVLVYQINDEKDTNRMSFARYGEWKDGIVDTAIYELVYAGEVKADDLEDVFEIFNTSRPNDIMGNRFAGHSLSVSDIVMTDKDDGIWYCDWLGWQNIKGKTINSEVA